MEIKDLRAHDSSQMFFFYQNYMYKYLQALFCFFFSEKCIEKGSNFFMKEYFYKLYEKLRMHKIIDSNKQ